jgi:hypothetical protein
MRVCVAALSTYKLDRDRLVLLRVEAWFQRRKKKRPLARQWQHGAGCHAPPWCGTFVDDAKAALANLAEDLVLFAHHLQRRRAPRRRARRIRAPPRRLHRRRLHRTHRPRALRHGPASPRSTKARHSTARTHAGSGADRGRFQSIEDSTALTLGYVTNGVFTTCSPAGVCVCRCVHGADRAYARAPSAGACVSTTTTTAAAGRGASTHGSCGGVARRSQQRARRGGDVAPNDHPCQRATCGRGGRGQADRRDGGSGACRARAAAGRYPAAAGGSGECVAGGQPSSAVAGERRHAPGRWRRGGGGRPVLLPPQVRQLCPRWARASAGACFCLPSAAPAFTAPRVP